MVLLALEGQERMDEIHLAVDDGIHVVFDIFRVGGDDGGSCSGCLPSSNSFLSYGMDG